MRVLIADFDFFSTIGGGQILYQRVVERNPQIEFYYLSRGPDLERQGRGLPGNAHPVRYEVDNPPTPARETDRQWIDANTPDQADWVAYGLFTEAHRIAASVRGMRFDAVDVPSFRAIAHLIKPCLRHFDASPGKVVLSLLGWISIGMKNGWEVETGRQQIDVLERFERLSFNAADLRYSISRTHIRENSHLGDLPIELIDMHDIIEQYETQPEAGATATGGPVDIWYIGRLDRNKGPDIFLDLVSDLPETLVRSVNISGPDACCAPGVNWSDEIAATAPALGVDYTYHGALATEDIVQRVYYGRSIVVVPSRTDTFNLVVTEAALRGCPVVVSTRAGVYSFLQEHYPDFPVHALDINDLTAGRKLLADLVENYDAAKAALVASLRAKPWRKYRRGFMQEIYQ